MAASALASLSSARAFRAPSGPRRAARRSRATFAPTRAAARSEFADFFPDEVTALEEPAAVEMARRASRFPSPTSRAATHPS